MARFHFQFEGQSYNAEAAICRKNGTVSCNILRVLKDNTDQQVFFKGFSLGPMAEDQLPINQAIQHGLNRYLLNFPVARASVYRMD